MKCKTMLATTLLALCLVGCGNTKVAIDDAVSIKFTGLDTKGQAHLSYSTGGVVNNVITANHLKDTMETEMRFDKLASQIHVELDKENDLSNGDEVTATFTSTPEADKYFKVPKTLTFKVEGLQEVKKLSAEDFKKMTSLEITGFNKEGKATVHIKDPFLKGIEIKVENNGKLENGKDVKLTIPSRSIELLENSACIIEGEPSYTMPVTGLLEVATDFNQIKNKDELLEKLDKKINSRYDKVEIGKKYYRGYAENIGDSGTNFFSGPNIVDTNGTLVAVIKPNILFVDSYVVYGFYNLVIDKDGNVDVSNAKILDRSFDTKSEAEQKLEAIGYKEVQ